MKKAAALVVLILVAAGGAYLYARQRAGQEMEARLAAFRASLPAGSTFSYASAAPRLLGRSAHLTGVALSARSAAYTAETADVTPGPGNSLRHLALTKLTSKAAGGEAAADSLAVDNLGLPVLAASVAEIDPAAVTFDHGELHGLSVSAYDGTKLAAKDVAIEHYGAGQQSAAELAGLDLQTAATTAIHAQVEQFHARRAPLADMVARAEATGSTAGFPNPHYDAGLSALSMSVQGKKLLTLASLDLGSDPAGASFDDHLALHGLVLQADGPLIPALAQLGYQQVQADAQMHAMEDHDARQLRMDKLDIDAAGMGRLHLAMELDDMPERTAGIDIGALLQTRLQGLTVAYDDQGLAAKYLAMLATRQGTTPEALKQQGKAALAAAAAQAGLPPAVIDPLRAFLDDPRRLVVTLTPPQPVALADLAGGAGNDPQRLGLMVTN